MSKRGLFQTNKLGEGMDHIKINVKLPCKIFLSILVVSSSIYPPVAQATRYRPLVIFTPTTDGFAAQLPSKEFTGSVASSLIKPLTIYLMDQISRQTKSSQEYRNAIEIVCKGYAYRGDNTWNDKLLVSNKDDLYQRLKISSSGRLFLSCPRVSLRSDDTINIRFPKPWLSGVVSSPIQIDKSDNRYEVHRRVLGSQPKVGAEFVEVTNGSLKDPDWYKKY